MLTSLNCAKLINIWRNEGDTVIKSTSKEHRLLEGIDTCVYLVDPEGRLIDANTSWQIFYGFRIDFVRGQSIRDLLRFFIIS